MGGDDGQFRNEEEAAVDGALARRTLLAHRVADGEGESKCIRPDGCWLHGAVTRVTSQVRVTDHTVDPTPSTQAVLATTPALLRATDGESATRMAPSQRTRIVLLRMLLLVTVAAIVLASYAWHASLEQHRALAEPPPQATRSKFRLLRGAVITLLLAVAHPLCTLAALPAINLLFSSSTARALSAAVGGVKPLSEVGGLLAIVATATLSAVVQVQPSSHIPTGTADTLPLGSLIMGPVAAALL